jgi:diguanylate cyclase (GGDEF)-like protein
MTAGAAMAGAVWGAVAALALAADPARHGVLAVLGLANAVLGLACRGAHLAPASAYCAASLAPLAATTLAFGQARAGVALALGLVATLIAAWAGGARSARAARLEAEREESEATLAVLAERAEVVARAGEPEVGEGGEGLAAAMLEQSRDALLVVGADGRIEQANRRAAELLDGATLVGAPAAGRLRLVDAAARTSLGDPASDAVREAAQVHLRGEETLLQAEDGRELSVEVRATPLPGGRALVGVEDVTEVLGVAGLVSWHAAHDQLTGLANRAGLEHRIALERAQAERSEQAGAVIYIDLDGLDAVNDAWGLHAGDAILQTAAERLTGLLRESDLLARIGGDRFVALLSACPLGDALQVAERANAALGLPWEGGAFRLRASIGVAVLDGARDAVPGPLGAAALAAMVARDAGGGRIHVYRPDDAAVVERAELGRWLRSVRNAVHEGELRLLGQPIVPTGASENLRPHVEILVRVPGREGALTTPETFIAAAEHLGLMPEVDRWVLSRTLNLLGSSSPSLARYATCAVNLSAQSLVDPEFPGFAAEQLEAAGVDGARIVLEITETAVIGDLERVRVAMDALRALGCGFALDDFGTGHSSYARLRALGVDYLKIDGTLVRNVAEDPAERAVVESINRVAHALGLRTVAEHVTGPQVLEVVRAIGVDYAQGTAVGAPAALD